MENKKKNKAMNVLILGAARHGKDTVAEILKKRFGIRHQSSSSAALDIFLFDILNNKYGLNYKSKEEAFEDRVNHRDKWYNEICEYNKKYKGRLAKEIMENNEVYVGMRSKDEIDACRNSGIFDLVIGVIDPRKPEESKDSNDVDTVEESDVVIYNDGTLEELEEKVLDVWSRAMFNFKFEN